MAGKPADEPGAAQDHLAGSVVAAITVSLLLISQAMEYSGNIALRMKFAVLALIAIDMLAFRLFVYPGVSKWARDAAIESGRQACDSRPRLRS